jgi:hypothetical protein
MLLSDSGIAVTYVACCGNRDDATVYADPQPNISLASYLRARRAQPFVGAMEHLISLLLQ